MREKHEALVSMYIDEAWTIQELALWFRMTPTTVSRVLQRYRTNGWVVAAIQKHHERMHASAS